MATTTPPAADLDQRLARLPGYTRSLLKVPVTVVVVLAEKKTTVKELLEMATGTIFQFDRRYDKPLQLAIGRHVLAEGEVVKVGEYFGLRISSIALPQERFTPVLPDAGSPPAADPAPSSDGST